MRRIIVSALISIMVLSLAVPAFCDDPVKKLGRGICNTISCPLEILDQVKKTNNSDGPAAGITLGVLKGVGMMCVRAIVGVYEIATFPIPIPKDYKPILTDPEFFFEETIW